MRILKQRQPDAPQHWKQKFPKMAKRLEESLYRIAPSFEEYNDESTLTSRITRLAQEVSRKLHEMRQQAPHPIPEQQAV